MRIAIGLWGLTGFGGTETYALTVAAEFERMGHDVWIYAPESGPSTDWATTHGFRVVQEDAHLPACDAVLAQDTLAAYALARRFPDAVRVMVAHSPSFALQSPPQLPGVCQAVVVMNDRLRRRTEALAWHPVVARLRQPIDLQRFCFRATNLGDRWPPRVLLLSNHSQGVRHEMVEAACAIAGFEFTHVGSSGTPTANPELVIADSEVVVSLGRGVLEAMASGRATYVFGQAGGDGWVTEDTYPAMESEGFSGRALGHAVSVERMADDLAQWHQEMGEVGRDIACTHHSVEVHAVELIELFEKVGPPIAPPPTDAGEMARLVRLEWERTGQVRAAGADAARRRAEATRLEAEMAALAMQLSDARAQSSGLQADAADLRSQLSRRASETFLLQARVVDQVGEMADLRRQLANEEAEAARLRRWIAAVDATRTMRWTRSARRLYGHVRSMLLGDRH